MIEDYDGLCALINKTGVCYQCSALQQIADEGHRGANLVQIEVARGIAMNAESLFDARLDIVREADLAMGRTRAVHDLFLAAWHSANNRARRWKRALEMQRLEVEGAERNVLRSDVQGAAEGEFARAAVQRFFGGDAREIGRVVLLGNVRENQVARARIENFRIGKKFADDRV